MESMVAYFLIFLLPALLGYLVWKRISSKSPTKKTVPYKIVRGEKVTGEDKKKKVCAVVGGTGFIGSHIVDELVKRNEYHVYVLGRKFRPERTNPDADCLIQVDIQDLEGLEKAFEGVDSVITVVGIESNCVYDSDDEKLHLIKTGYGNILKAATKAGVKYYVHCSAVHVKPPKSLAMKATLDCFYLVEREVLEANKDEGLKTCVIGPTNVVGLNSHVFDPLVSGKRTSFIMVDIMPISFVPVEYVARAFVNAERKLTTDQSEEVAGKFFPIHGEFMSWKKLLSLPTWPKKISNTSMWVLSFMVHINVGFAKFFRWAPFGAKLWPGLLDILQFSVEQPDESQVAEVYKILEVGPPSPPMEEYIKELVEQYKTREESHKED